MKDVDVAHYCSEIIPGLYLGSLSGLALLDAMGITHVLSVVPFPLQKDLSRYTTLQLPLQDTETENLLQWLPAACRFLDAALGPAVGPRSDAAAAGAGAAGAPAAADDAPPGAEAPSQPAVGTPSAADDTAATAAGVSLAPSLPQWRARVFVHCQAGVSRSPAVIAAWLMRSHGYSYFDAMKLIRGRRSVADPNDGFVAQLQLFEEMRCTLDMDHPVYKMWALEQVGRKWEEDGYVDPDTFGQLPEGNAAAQGLALYRCRKCRALLATSAHTMPVEAAMGHKVFRARQRVRKEQAGVGAERDSQSQPDGAGDSSLFLQPMQWMASTITGVVQGKLYCPANCGARLGSFNWSGITNTSGAWVTPAFQLHLSKVDTLESKPLAALATVRRPLVGPAAAAAGATGAAAGPGPPPVLPPTLPAALRRAVGAAGPETQGDQQKEEEEEVRWQEEEAEEQEQPHTPAPGAAPQVQTSPRAAPPQQQQPQAGVVSGSSNGVCHDVAQAKAQPLAQPDDLSAAVTAPGQASAPPATPLTSAWFSHLLLDCDGVMVDSEAASCEALRRAILEVTGFDIPHAFPADYVEVFGMDVRSCVAHYRHKFERDDWEAAEALAPRVQAAKEVHYRELTSGGIKAFEGAERLMRRALEAGMQLGVASSGAPEKIHRNLSTSGLLSLLQPHAIVSASSVPAGKPAPDVYIAAMQATCCADPVRALVVEDAVNGLKAARAAGAYTVGITNQLPREVLAPWADEVVAHLDEIDPARMRPRGAKDAAE